MNGTYHPPQHHKAATPHTANNHTNIKDKSNGWSKVRRSPDAEEHQFDMDM